MILRLSDTTRLRPQQFPLFDAFFNNGIKHIIRVAHRRFGKDFEAFSLTWCAALEKRGIYIYYLPTIGQSRRVIWDTIGEDGTRLVDRIPKRLLTKLNGSDQTITLLNGSIIYITGSDNYKRMVGLNATGIVYSEYQDTNPAATDAMRPMVTRNKGWQMFIGTPRAYNHFGQLYEMQKDNPEWLVTSLTINDTYDHEGKPIITEEDIEAERRNGMPEELIQQEYYGSWDAAIRGAYYSKQFIQARKENRIGNFPINPQFPVYTGADLGFDDHFAIWFFQHYNERLFFVGYYENREQDIAHYCSVMKAKQREWGCRYSTHFAPHDIEVRELGPGKSRKAIALENGIMFRTVQRPARKIHGIHVVRHMFPRMHFNEPTCRQGLKHLTEYRSDYNEKDDIYSLEPKRTAATHGSDAMQTAMLGWMKAFDDNGLKKQIEISNLYGSTFWV
jgi:hypothetical protein